MLRSAVCTCGRQIIGFQITVKNMHLPPEPSSIFASGSPDKLAASCTLQVRIHTQLASGSFLFCLLKVSGPTSKVSQERHVLLAIKIHLDSPYLARAAMHLCVHHLSSQKQNSPMSLVQTSYLCAFPSSIQRPHSHQNYYKN